jgi:hypothetical protein
MKNTSRGKRRLEYEKSFLSCAMAAADVKAFLEEHRRINERRFTDNRHRVIYRGLRVIELEEWKEDSGDFLISKSEIFKRGMEAAGALELAGGVEYINEVWHTTGTSATGGFYAEALLADSAERGWAAAAKGKAGGGGGGAASGE